MLTLSYITFSIWTTLYAIGEGLTEDATWNWKKSKVGVIIKNTADYHFVRRFVESFGIWMMIVSALCIGHHAASRWEFLKLLLLFPWWTAVYNSTKMIERGVKFKDINNWPFDFWWFGKTLKIKKLPPWLMWLLGVAGLITYLSVI